MLQDGSQITVAEFRVVQSGVIMNKFHSHSMKALALSASVIAFSTAVPAFAQDMEPGEDCLVDNVPGVVNADGDCVEVQEGPTGASTTAPDDVEIATGAQGETGAQSAITVTGSRIRRDTYSSISPLQVISTENQQSVGAFDPSQILQRSEAAAGTQIDATFQGFVLDNGPGSQTLNLRGLGADRTLLLVNGRRLAPAGVEGAPTVPSLNLIPATLVDRYDLLLDGASSACSTVRRRSMVRTRSRASVTLSCVRISTVSNCRRTATSTLRARAKTTRSVARGASTPTGVSSGSVLNTPSVKKSSFATVTFFPAATPTSKWIRMATS